MCVLPPRQQRTQNRSLAIEVQAKPLPAVIIVNSTRALTARTSRQLGC